jgi:hypothetical protein
MALRGIGFVVPDFLPPFVGCRLPLFVARFREVCQAGDQFRLRLRPPKRHGSATIPYGRLERITLEQGEEGRGDRILCLWGIEGRALSPRQLNEGAAHRGPHTKRGVARRQLPCTTQWEGLATRQRMTAVSGSALYGNWGAGVNDKSSRCGR